MTATVQAQTRTAAELEKAADEAVQNALILNPKLPLPKLAEALIDDAADAPLILEWRRAVLARDIITRARRLKAEARRIEREKQFTFAFPAIREQLSVLPSRLRKGTLLKTDYRKYLTEINSEHRESQKRDKRKIAAQSVIKLFPKGRKNRGLTIAEVDALKARKAGLA